MYDDLAEFADSKQVVFVFALSLHGKTDIALPIVLIEVRMYDYLRELTSHNEHFGRDFLEMRASSGALTSPTL